MTIQRLFCITTYVINAKKSSFPIWAPRAIISYADPQEKIDAKNLFLSDIIDVDEYDFGRNENENEESDNDQHVEYGAASLATYMHKFGKMVNEMGEFPVHVIRQHIPESFDASEW